MRLYEMRKETPSFLERAPVRHEFIAVVAAPRAAVFAAIADPTTWPRWFPGVRAARYHGAPPYGIGTTREADVSGTRWIEEMIAWDDGRRWAYTVTHASAPLAWAQVESFDLDDAPGGTRVRWTLALEPRLVQRLAAPIAPSIMRRLFARAMRNLGSFLSGQSVPGRVDVDRWMTRINPIVVALLRSPLHFLLDGGLMLITVTGRRSGRRYTIPVGYQRHGDLVRVLVSKARRKQWWRNYLQAAEIEVQLRGQRWRGEARVVERESELFRTVVDETLRRLPMLGGQLGIVYDRRTGLTGEQLRTIRHEAALVEIRLAKSGPT